MPKGHAKDPKEKSRKIKIKRALQIPPMLGKNHSLETRIKMSKYVANARWNYRNNITTLNKRIYDSYKYRQWRRGVFERDNFTCQKCKKRGGHIEAHHKRRFSEIMIANKIKSLEEALRCKELWDKDNGVTLCKDCHNLTKKGGAKKDV